ncbi:MAG: hypothetical protein RLZZ437_1441 [Pseudomonadota bacterium]|jgi:hypothetical protein
MLSIMLRVFFLPVILSGCVSVPISEKVWQLGSAAPQVTVSGPQESNTSFAFTLTIKNLAPIPVCYDGNAEFMIGLGIRNADTGASLSWVDGPIAAGGGGVTTQRYLLEAGESVSQVIQLPRPLAGPYSTPFVDSRYNIGDRLVAVGGEEFYSCEYGSTLEAMANEGTLVVFSDQSKVFQE